MSKKDFERIARVLRDLRSEAVAEMLADNDYWTREACGQDTEEAEESGRLAGVVDGIDSVATAFATEFRRTDLRFSIERFAAAYRATN